MRGKPYKMTRSGVQDNTDNFQHKCQLLGVMQSQELPWNPFASKPAPPAGILSHYYFFQQHKRSWLEKKCYFKVKFLLRLQSDMKLKSKFKAIFLFKCKATLLWSEEQNCRLFIDSVKQKKTNYSLSLSYSCLPTSENKCHI